MRHRCVHVNAATVYMAIKTDYTTSSIRHRIYAEQIIVFRMRRIHDHFLFRIEINAEQMCPCKRG